MSQHSQQPKKIRSSTAIFLSAILLGWIALFLAAVGLFYRSIIIVAIATLAAGIFFLAKQKRITPIPANSYSAIIPFVVIMAVIIAWAPPSIFSGRDQGSLSEAAVLLSSNHQLAFSTNSSELFFKIYGTGKALNFPGFYYLPNGQLSTQFPLGYIAWSAMFYSLFGNFGFQLGNIALFILFIIGFYRLLAETIEPKVAILGLLFVILSFSFIWFFKYTLSETMALALLWIAIAELSTFVRRLSPFSFTTAFASLGLLLFTRIEGVIFLAIGIILVLALSRTRQFIRQHQIWTIFIPTMLLATFFILVSNRMIPFFIEMGHQAYNSIADLIQPNANGKNSLFLWTILFRYGLASFILFGVGGAVLAIRQKSWRQLLPLVIVFPTLAYLIEPRISGDHPWMLRRYLISVLPVAIYYSVLLIHQLKFSPLTHQTKKVAATLVVIICVGFSWPAFYRYALAKENSGLFDQTKKFSAQFETKDLVLVDRSVTGDGWSMITGPMSAQLGKEVVYFFNPNDLTKLNLSRFQHTYLVVAKSEAARYTDSIIGTRLVSVNDVTFSTARLESTANQGTFSFPSNQPAIVENVIFQVTQ